jgi:hypothetical protein
VHQGAGLLQLHQAQVRPAVLRTFQSRVGLKRWKLSVAGHHRQAAGPVRVSVAAAQSEDNPATASLPRHLRVRVLAKREGQKSEANRESIDLQPRRLAGQVRAKREAEESEGKVPMVNLVGSQEAARHLLLSKGRGRESRSAERKRERGLHRQGHNNSC